MSNKKGVYVELRGGLGNQLFQFACGYSLARKYRRDLWLVTSHLVEGVRTPRQFELASFNIQNQIAQSVGIGKLPPNSRSLNPDEEMADLLPQRHVNRSVSVLREKSLEFRPLKLWSQRNVYLSGYWQSEEYFSDVSDELRLMLQNPLDSSLIEGLADEILADSSGVCLQIRRGDYASDEKVRAVHGLLDLEYFQGALTRLNDDRPISQVYVFSDDPDWCRENVKVPFPSVVIQLPRSPHEAAHNLILLSKGHRFVLSNSTFGWWGAWLSGKPGTEIVAPTRWFSERRLEKISPVPTDWTRA